MSTHRGPVTCRFSNSVHSTSVLIGSWADLWRRGEQMTLFDLNFGRSIHKKQAQCATRSSLTVSCACACLERLGLLKLQYLELLLLWLVVMMKPLIHFYQHGLVRSNTSRPRVLKLNHNCDPSPRIILLLTRVRLIIKDNKETARPRPRHVHMSGYDLNES